MGVSRYTVHSLKGSDEKKEIVPILQTNDIEKAKSKMKSEAKNVDMYAGVTITDNKTGNMKVYRGFSLLEKIHDTLPWLFEEEEWLSPKDGKKYVEDIQRGDAPANWAESVNRLYVGRIAVKDDKGNPHVTPVWFAVSKDGKKIAEKDETKQKERYKLLVDTMKKEGG